MSVLVFGEPSKLFLVSGVVSTRDHVSSKIIEEREVIRLVLARHESEAKDKFKDAMYRTDYGSVTEATVTEASEVIV
jgi:hypothetical protein